MRRLTGGANFSLVGLLSVVAQRIDPRAQPPAVVPERGRRIIPTREFERWWDTLDVERRTKVDARIKRILAGGPTLGRPHADVLHSSALHKLKEARVDRGVRVLFAFDSNRDLVMLLGGDKMGKWNRWYDKNISRAERLYAEHERSIGKGAQCLRQRETGRTFSQRSL